MYGVRWRCKDLPMGSGDDWAPSSIKPAQFPTINDAQSFARARGQAYGFNEYWVAEYPSGNKVEANGRDNESTSLAARPKSTSPVRDVFPADWRAWRDHGRASNECACGIHRAQCDYHRE